MALIQLIYVSTAIRQLNETEIRQILDSSIRHNTPQDVTGLLLYSSGNFMQVLEGEEVAVVETMSRIEKDPLHHSIIEVTRMPIAAREFGSWAMGFSGVTAHDVASWPGYAPFFQFGFNAELLNATPGIALEILQHFAGLVESSASFREG